VLKSLFGGIAGNAASDSAALGALPDEEVLNVLKHYRTALGEETFQSLLGTVLAMAQSPELIPQVRKFITDQSSKP
jgi:hypothetical protein